MNKNIFLLVLLLFTVHTNLNAKKITTAQARQQAYHFWREEMPQKAKGQCTLVETRALGNSPSYYVFNNNNGGFVIIAGDDMISPVLGYTTEGSFDTTNLPEGLKDLLNNYDSQIKVLGKIGNPNKKTEESQVSAGNKQLNTAKWNQDYPYNQYTPNNCVTGCVATAGAIVMKYYGWPSHGMGSHSYTWGGQTLSANYEHDYDWENMPIQYKEGDNASKFTGVARLMADVGIAINMQYTSKESSANISDLANALIEHFCFSQKAHIRSAENFEKVKGSWTKKLRAEIDANHPIIYSAQDEQGGKGHAFVIDGYKEENFSINWGWGGHYNGYYRLGALNPRINGPKYNLNQFAIFDLEPAKDEEKISPLVFGIYSDSFTKIKMNINVTDIKAKQPFSLYTGFLMPIANQGFFGDIAVALKNAKGEIKEILYRKSLENFWGGMLEDYRSLICESTIDAEKGDYIALVTQKLGEEEYIEIKDADFENARLPATNFTPYTADINIQTTEDAVVIPIQEKYDLNNLYQGKPILGTNFYFTVNIDKQVEQSFVLINGKLVGEPSLNNNVLCYEINTYESPKVDIEVKTYREYTPKSFEVKVEQAGTLEKVLQKEKLDYFIYTKMKVTGSLNVFDFPILSTYPFSDIDMSECRIEGYKLYSRANAIPSLAFFQNYYLESIKIPIGVTSIENDCFCQCNIKIVDIPATVTDFGDIAFAFCKQLTDVYMHHKKPCETICENTFQIYETNVIRTLHVPEGCKSAYENNNTAQVWLKYFDNIVEDINTGIINTKTVINKDKNANIYDLNGWNVLNYKKKGIYIKNKKKYVNKNN